MAAALALSAALVSAKPAPTVVAKHPNGNVSERAEVDDKGRRHGVSKRYYDDGKIESTLTFREGKLEGPGFYYYRDGGTREIAVYAGGRKLTSRRFDSQGRLIADEEYDEKGAVKPKPSPRATPPSKGMEI